MKYFIFSILALALSGCATVRSSDCQTADWEKIGLIDGRHGEPASKLNSHGAVCKTSGAQVDEIAYEQGRQKGLADYCTIEGVYHSAAIGEPFQDVCPTDQTKLLKSEWALGSEHYRLSLRRRQAQADLEKRRKDIDDDHSVIADISKGTHLLTGTSPTESEQDRVDRIDDEIYKNEKLAPPSAIPTGSSDTGFGAVDPLSFMKNIFGIGVGFTIGFGSGHAVQGHYRIDGWKWTAIDAAVMTSLIVTIHNCPSTGPDGKGSSCPGIAALSILSFAVSRIWEAVELAGYTVNRVDRYHNEAAQPQIKSFTVVPIADTYGIGAEFSY
jgi:hypothetical protein